MKLIKPKIKSNDIVIVIAGKDKGKTGKVLKVNKEKGKILVAGIHQVKKSVKKDEMGNQGFNLKEAYFDYSNVMLYSSKTKRGVRVSTEVEKDGKKVRKSAKTGEKFD